MLAGLTKKERAELRERAYVALYMFMRTHVFRREGKTRELYLRIKKCISCPRGAHGCPRGAVPRTLPNMHVRLTQEEAVWLSKHCASPHWRSEEDREAVFKWFDIGAAEFPSD